MSLQGSMLSLPPNSLVMDFAALDLNLWHGVLRKEESGQEDAASLARSQLRKKAFRLVRAHPRVTDVQGVCSELCRLAVKLCRELRRAKPGVDGLSSGPGSFCKDNRVVWGRAMAGGVSPGLYAVVCWYISIIDGTGQVERDLGSLRKVLETHVGRQMGKNAALLAQLRFIWMARSVRRTSLCMSTPAKVTHMGRQGSRMFRRGF